MPQPPAPTGSPMTLVSAYPPVERVDRSPWGWYKHVLFNNYANFDGRARRAEFWWFHLVSSLIMVAIIGPVIAIASASDPNEDEPAFVVVFLVVVVVVYALAVAIPGIAAAVRRLHDTDRSGAWYFISFVPYIGGFILLYLLTVKGTLGSNSYGPDPKGSSASNPIQQVGR